MDLQLVAGMRSGDVIQWDLIFKLDTSDDAALKKSASNVFNNLQCKSGFEKITFEIDFESDSRAICVQIDSKQTPICKIQNPICLADCYRQCTKIYLKCCIKIYLALQIVYRQCIKIYCDSYRNLKELR